MRSCCIEVPTPHPSLQQQQVQHHGQLVWGQAGRGRGAVQPLGVRRCPRAGMIAAAKTKLTMLLSGRLGAEAPHVARFSHRSGTRAKQSPSQLI